jgi:hypothetical protein
MDDRHFRQGVRDDQRDNRSHKIGDDHAGTGELNGDATTEKQPNANRAANGQHGELALAQAPVKIGGIRRSCIC